MVVCAEPELEPDVEDVALVVDVVNALDALDALDFDALDELDDFDVVAVAAAVVVDLEAVVAVDAVERAANMPPRPRNALVLSATTTRRARHAGDLRAPPAPFVPRRLRVGRFVMTWSLRP